MLELRTFVAYLAEVGKKRPAEAEVRRKYNQARFHLLRLVRC